MKNRMVANTRKLAFCGVAFWAVLGASTGAWGQMGVWESRVNGSFSSGANWADGVVPAAGGGTVLSFVNPGISSYRAFNDLGDFSLGGIKLNSKTNTATFIGVSAAAGSNLFRFVDGAELTLDGNGQWRFGGVTTSPAIYNQTKLDGTLKVVGSGSGVVWFSGGLSNGSGAGKIVLDHDAPNRAQGQLKLDGTNTFTGGVELVKGNLAVSNAAALGTGTITVAGGSLRTTASLTIANPINLTGSLHLTPQDSTFTISGPISGNGSLTLTSLDLSIAQSVTLSASNSYTGATIIKGARGVEVGPTKAGTLAINGPTASIASSSSYSVSDGGVLALTNTNGSANQLSDTAPISLSSGRINVVGSTATAGTNVATNENVGTMSVTGGSILFINAGRYGATLATPSISRVGRGTLQITTGTSSVNTAAFARSTANPGMVGGIVPWMTGTGGTLITAARNLVTWDNGTLRTLADAEYNASLASGGNVKLTSTTDNNDSVTVNALVLGVNGGNGTTTASITGTGTVNVTSGAVVLATSGGISNDINFGSAEGVITTATIISPFTGSLRGSNGVTFAGEFAFELATPMQYTGVTTINGGGIRFTNPDTFDSTSGFVNNTNGNGELRPSLDFRGNGVAEITAPAVVEGGVFRLGATQNTGHKLLYAGQISGDGMVALEGETSAASSGTVELTADNTYKGGTRLTYANVLLNRDSNLGDPSGEISTGSSVITLTGDWTTSRKIRITNSTTINTQGFTATLTGPIEDSGALAVLGTGKVRIIGETENNGSFGVGSSTGVPGTLELIGSHNIGASIYSTLIASGRAGRLTTFTPTTGIGGTLDIGGTGTGASLTAVRIALSAGTSVNFDLGPGGDYMMSLLDLANPTSINSTGPVTFNFVADASLPLGTYVLAEYFEQPTTAQSFAAGDLAYTSNVEGLTGEFELVAGTNAPFALVFHVTAIPEPSVLGTAGVLGLVGLGRRRR